MGIQITSGDSIYLLKPDLLGKGETARVFPAYLEGETPAQARWAIKLAKNQQHNIYIEREYETLLKLHQAMSSLPKTTWSLPAALPNAQLGASTDGRKALIMQPLLHHPLLEIFEGLTEPLEREKLALTAARQYADLLQALVKANLSCLDRKLGDLWWVGDIESGQLIITDWNVVSETANQVMDLRRFGLLWFELVVGRQMPGDFQPRRRDFDQIEDKVSYGLWYVIGRALGSSMGPQFDLLPELADFLDELSGFYHQPPQALVQQAWTNLKKAQSCLDRTEADLAWIQFDIAQRLGARRPTTGLEQAQLWAYDPVTQAAPDLIRKLASPNFSEAMDQLQELWHKVQRPQELGDIERLRFGFDLLNNAKDVLIKARATSDLAQVAQEFAEIQDLLVEGALRPLMAKDGSTVQKPIQQLMQLLPEDLAHGGLDKLISLDLEAVFWVEYQNVQKNLYTRPDLAMKALEKTRATREVINHWPAAYEPTLGDLDRLQAVVEANLRSAILASEVETVTKNSEPVEAGAVTPQITPSETSSFWLSLGEDLVKNRWGETLAELLSKLALEPENDGFRIAVKEILQRLGHKRHELAESRPSPGRLAERAGILEAILHMPADFTPDLTTAQELRQELAEIRDLQSQIAQAQQHLFQDPGQVLSRALANGYELFDDPGLTVAALKTVHETGRWDNHKFNQETVYLEEQGKRFLTITNLLEERKQTLEQSLAFYSRWAEDPPSAETSAFFTNTLRLYLITAQAQLQAGDSTIKSLDKAGHLLEHAKQFLAPADYTIYQNLYEHLLEVSNGQLKPKLESASLTTPITEARLEAWFKGYRFEDCHNNLSKLTDEAQKSKWLTRLNDAGRLRDILAQDEPQSENNFFRKKQNVQIHTEALDTLQRHARDSGPMAYALYQNAIERRYERIRQQLEQLDKKSAKRFESSLQVAKETR